MPFKPGDRLKNRMSTRVRAVEVSALKIMVASCNAMEASIGAMVNAYYPAEVGLLLGGFDPPLEHGVVAEASLEVAHRLIHRNWG